MGVITIKPILIGKIMTVSEFNTPSAINQLVRVSEAQIGSETVNSVDARELHTFLEVRENFNEWIKRYLTEYGFVINSDFCRSSCIADNGREMETYTMSLDMAKELSMLSKTNKGKEARKYFIACEKKPKHGAIDVQMVAIKYAIEILNVSDISKLQMMHKVFEINGVSTDILPAYVENARVTFSLTDLINKTKGKVKTQAFNKLLLVAGYLEEKERPSKSKGVKKFKALTEKGLQFGTNDISPSNPREVQPHYFECTFGTLFSELTK